MNHLDPTSILTNTDTTDPKVTMFLEDWDTFRSDLQVLTDRVGQGEIRHRRQSYARFLKTHADLFATAIPKDTISFSAKEDLEEEETEEAEAYLSKLHDATIEYFGERFVRPWTNENTVFCLCGGILTSGNLIDTFRSTFTWGIVHGQGYCSQCKLPIQMKHYITIEEKEDEEDEELIFSYPLVFHPSGLVIEKEMS